MIVGEKMNMFKMTCSREKANTHRSTTSIRGGDVAGAVKETELFLGCALSFVAAAEFSGGQHYNDYNDKSIFPMCETHEVTLERSLCRPC